MIKFPSIESFRHSVANVRRACDYRGIPYPTLMFEGSVKLHGTNAGIHYDPKTGKLTAQSRERVLSVDSDNYGFARWVEENKEALTATIYSHGAVTLYGEWIGPGIQKNVAINNLPERQFVAFAFVWDDDVEELPDGSTQLVMYNIGPDFAFMNNIPGLRSVNEVPYVNLDIDFNQPDAVVSELERLTAEYESRCPWGALHGIDGIGEGLVWRIVEGFGDNPLPRNLNTRFSFKTKGEKHGNKGTKNTVKVAVTAEKIEDFKALCDQILPDWRFEQGAAKLLETRDALMVEQTGEFIKWVVGDVYKEELDTVEASEFEWKVVAGELSKRARTWFLNRVRL